MNSAVGESDSPDCCMFGVSLFDAANQSRAAYRGRSSSAHGREGLLQGLPAIAMVPPPTTATTKATITTILFIVCLPSWCHRCQMPSTGFLRLVN